MRVIGGDVRPNATTLKRPVGFGTCTVRAAFQRSSPQNLETQFLGPLDGKAALALDKLVAKKPLSTGERQQWTRFLLSLQFRQREHVALIKSHMADICREAIIASEDEWARPAQAGGDTVTGRGDGRRARACPVGDARREDHEGDHRPAPRRARHHGDALVLHRSAGLAHSASDIGPADCLAVAVGP